jgi:S-adenosylmethionine:tRNA ribosyltransferase-isomerase
MSLGRYSSISCGPATLWSPTTPPRCPLASTVSMCRPAAPATLMLAAGISSTGDNELDKRLPFDEPYVVPLATTAAIRRVRARGRRVIAIGTTVVRALEHRATCDGRVQAGEGLATQRIGAASGLRIVDAILTGVHEPGTSNYELLRAFTDDATLGHACDEMTARNYRTHEFGDSVLIKRKGCRGLNVI